MSQPVAFGLIVALRLVITLLFVPAILVKLRNPVACGRIYYDLGLSTLGSSGH